MTSRREQFRAIFLATVMVVSMVAMGATALAGSAAADASDDNDVSADVGGDVEGVLNVGFDDRDGNNEDPVPVFAGGGEEQLPRLDIVDVDGVGVIDGHVDVTLPENLTFNPEESDISVTGDVEEDDFEFEDDNQRLSFDLADKSEDDGDRFSISGIVVDTDTVDVDLDEDESEKFDIEVDTADGEPGEYERIQIFKNTIDDGETEVPADSDSELGDNVVLNVPDANEFFDRDEFSESLNNLPVADGSDIVISPNVTAGITFDADAMEQDDIEFADDGVLGAHNDGDIDVDNIEISEEEVRIPVNESFQSDTFLEIEGGLDFAATPDADDNTELSIFYEPTNSTGEVEAFSGYDINVVNPDFAVFDNEYSLIDVAAGVDDQDISGAFNIEELDGVDASTNYAPFAVTPTDDNQITTGQNVTLVMNSSEVTFSENNEEDLAVSITNSDGAIIQDGLGVHTTVDESAGESMLTFELEEDSIDDNLYDEDGVFNHQQAIAVGAADSASDADPIAMNVSNNVEEDDRVGFELLTGDDNEVVSEENQDAETILEVDTVSLEPDLYEDEDEILVDAAGADGYELGLTLEMPASNDDSVNAIAADTNVTVDLSQAEFEFDTRSDFNPEDSAINTDRVGVDSNSLEFQFDDSVSQGDEPALFNTEHGALNFTAGAADVEGADMEITTDSSDSEMSVTETVESVDLNIDGVGAIEDRDELGDEIGLGETLEATDDAVAGEAETAWVIVANDSDYTASEVGDDEIWPYGGAEVDLEVEEHPDGVDTPSDRLNVSTVETAALDADESDEWGYAAFNFTGSVTGDYTINATVEDSHTLINYTVEASDKEALNVEGEENAFAGQVGDISDVEDEEDQKYRTGVYNVTVEDEFGNLVEDGDVRVQADSNDVRVLGFTDGLDDGVPEDDATVNDKSYDENLEGESVDVDFSDSSFFVIADTAGGSPVDSANLKLETVGADDDIEDDDGEVRFYDDADDAEFATEGLEEDVTEMTITFHTEAGDTIEIPRIDSTLDTDNASVVTFEGDEEIDESTDDAGEIVFNLTHEGVGTANITSDVDLTNDAYDDLEEVDELDTTFEVEDVPPADFQITAFDDIEITEGDTTDVEVTIENDGGQDGEQTVSLDIGDGEITVDQTEEIAEGDDTTITFEDVATDELDPDTYDMDVETDDDDATAELEVREDAADLSVTLDDVDIFEGNTTDIDVEIDNDGAADADDVEVELDIDDGTITVDDTVDVDSDDSATVTFEDVETDDLEPDEYEMEATATHDDDEASDTATLTVEEVEDEDDDGIPGFTAGIAALALLGAALLALRLRSQE